MHTDRQPLTSQPIRLIRICQSMRCCNRSIEQPNYLSTNHPIHHITQAAMHRRTSRSIVRQGVVWRITWHNLLGVQTWVLVLNTVQFCSVLFSSVGCFILGSMIVHYVSTPTYRMMHRTTHRRPHIDRLDYVSTAQGDHRTYRYTHQCRQDTGVRRQDTRPSDHVISILMVVY